MRIRGVIAPLVAILFLMGCGSDHSSESSTNPSPPGATPTTLQVDFPQPPFNTVTSASPKYQATQGLSATPQQSVTSQRYVMTVSMF